MKTLDLVPKPFFLVDYQKKRISFSNLAARKMMGFEYADHLVADVYGKNFSLFDLKGNLVPLTNLPSVRIVHGEKIVGEEFVLVSRIGKFNIKVFSEEISAMRGQPAAALIIFQDITVLKSNENTLRRAQTDLKEAIEIARIGFWSVDTVTSKITVSPQLMKQFGISEDQFDGSLVSITKPLHPEDRERVNRAIEISMLQGLPYGIEYRVVHPDRSILWIEAKSGSGGDPNRFSGTTVDITERVNSRKALEDNEQKLRLLADSMPQIVWSANPDGELDYFNKIWFDYSGSNFEENQGQRWANFVHPDD